MRDPYQVPRPPVVLDVVSAADASAALDKIIADLPNTHVLPQSRLEELAARGVIMSVMTFEDHMNPTVHWIEPEEFGAEFDRLVARGGPDAAA